MQDYLDLRLAVADFVGNRELSDVMKRLTTQAEIVLNRQLRTMWQIDSFTPVWTGNEAPLPADFLQLVGTDTALAVRGSTLYRQPYRTYPDGIDYYAALPTITTGPGGTNWLLAQFPNAYLYAVSIEAAKHMTKPDMAVAMAQALDGELAAIRIEDDRARYAHQAVRVAGLTP